MKLIKSKTISKNELKKLSKYIGTFDYFDKTYSATRGGISIISIAIIIGPPVKIASASFSLIISLTTGIIKKLLKIKRNKKKKHNKFVMLARGKLNSIETPVMKNTKK